MTTSRRRFLTLTAGVAAAGTLGAATATADVGVLAGQQPDWFFCDKCYVMFYNGYTPKGVCPAGGGHNAQGWNFILPWGLSDGGFNQPEWRYCEKCHGMFWNGQGWKGVCPAGGAHLAQGINFTLPHNYLQLPANSQPDWRYCYDCAGLFFAGYPSKGRCPVPTEHRFRSTDFHFMLPHLP
jgi:hypothetical protein